MFLNRKKSPEPTKFARVIVLHASTREFFTPIMPEPIPENTHAIAWTSRGYAFLTEEDLRDMSRRTADAAGGFVLPASITMSYYNVTY